MSMVVKSLVHWAWDNPKRKVCLIMFSEDILNRRDMCCDYGFQDTRILLLQCSILVQNYGIFKTETYSIVVIFFTLNKKGY